MAEAMAEAEPNQEVEETKGVFPEGSILRRDYALMLLPRWAFGVKLESDPLPEETDYLRKLDEKCFQIPENLMFGKLKNSIPDEHKEVVGPIWEALYQAHSAWQRTLRHLKKKMRAAPSVKDTVTKGVVGKKVPREQRELNRYICAVVHWPVKAGDDEEREELKKDPEALRNVFEKRKLTISSIIDSIRSRADAVLVSTLGRLNVQPYADKRLEEWKFQEKEDRRTLFDADKNYLTVLRLYLETLLERPPAHDERNPVLPTEHENRFNIVVLNRFARLIDAEHQGFAIAKAIHHEQPTSKRIREKKQEAYLWHVWGVMKQAIYDAIPHVIKEEKLPLNPVLLVFAAALHDVFEDSDLTLDTLHRNYIDRIANKRDSSLDQIIKSCFDSSREAAEKIKTKKLDLIGKGEWDDLKRVLKALSDNVALVNKEKRFAVEGNFAGEHTGRIVKAEGSHIRAWTAGETLPEPLDIFKQYPPISPPEEGAEEDRRTQAQRKHLAKLDRFILRLEAICHNDELKQYALIVKMEDRANNLLDIESDNPEKRRAKLYATTTRLIAYAMSKDYPLEEQPLYNALPRLIDITLGGYKRLQDKHPKVVAEDAALIGQLEGWAKTVKRYPNPTQETLCSGEASTQE